jgi:hypothetical protein
MIKTHLIMIKLADLHNWDRFLNKNIGGSPIKRHPLKGTCQEKKVLRKQERSVFLGRTMRLREWAAIWLVGAAATL